MADIFISHSSKDEVFAKSLCKQIEEAGMTCWIYERDLKTEVTRNYGADIVDAIRKSRIVLLVLTKASNKSGHVYNEISSACDNDKTVYVFNTEKVEIGNELAYYLSENQWCKDFDVMKTGDFSEIIEGLRRFLRVVSETPSDGFVDREYLKRNNYERLKESEEEKRRSFIMSIADGRQDEYDQYHLYEEIVRLDVVDSEENEWSSYRYLTIKNVSDNPTTYIIHKECGEDKAHFKKMRIRARLNYYKGEKLIVESMTGIQPNVKQVFRIYFDKPLMPEQSMKIFYRLEWPNEPSSYYKEELSQSISLLRYTQGVGKLIFGVFEPYSIKTSAMHAVSDMRIMHVSKSLPHYLTIDEEERLAPLHDKAYHGVEYEVNKPEDISYIIKYKIEAPEDDDDDDDFF